MQNDGMEEADSSETLVFACTTPRCHTKYDIILRVNSNFTGMRSLHDLGVKRAGKGMLRHDLPMTRIVAVSCSMRGCHVPHFSNAKLLLCVKLMETTPGEYGS